MHLLCSWPRSAGGVQNSPAKTRAPAANGLEIACELDLSPPRARQCVAGDARPAQRAPLAKRTKDKSEAANRGLTCSCSLVTRRCCSAESKLSGLPQVCTPFSNLQVHLGAGIFQYKLELSSCNTRERSTCERAQPNRTGRERPSSRIVVLAMPCWRHSAEANALVCPYQVRQMLSTFSEAQSTKCLYARSEAGSRLISILDQCQRLQSNASIRSEIFETPVFNGCALHQRSQRGRSTTDLRHVSLSPRVVIQINAIPTQLCWMARWEAYWRQPILVTTLKSSFQALLLRTALSSLCLLCLFCW